MLWTLYMWQTYIGLGFGALEIGAKFGSAHQLLVRPFKHIGPS